MVTWGKVNCRVDKRHIQTTTLPLRGQTSILRHYTILIGQLKLKRNFFRTFWQRTNPTKALACFLCAALDTEATEEYFRWYCLYFNMCLALKQDFYHTYLKPDEVKLWWSERQWRSESRKVREIWQQKQILLSHLNAFFSCRFWEFGKMSRQ